MGPAPPVPGTTGPKLVELGTEEQGVPGTGEGPWDAGPGTRGGWRGG